MDLRENRGLRALMECRAHQDHVVKREVLDLQVILESLGLKDKRVTLDIGGSLEAKVHLDFWGTEGIEE